MSRDQDAGAKRAADLAIKKVLEEHGEQANASTVWRVQGTAVISHKALERIAGRVGIRFDLPTILRAERDEAVMLVAGTRGDLREWSIGECVVNVNYRVSGRQAAYVYAMAEKRAKDRVILKLLALHGLAYSEEEADDFKARGEAIDQADEQAEERPERSEADQRAEYIAACKRTIAATTEGKLLQVWWMSADEKAARRDFGLSQAEIDALRDAVTARLQVIGRGSDGDDSRRAAA
jgi:hypothetical protein